MLTSMLIPPLEFNRTGGNVLGCSAHVPSSSFLISPSTRSWSVGVKMYLEWHRYQPWSSPVSLLHSIGFFSHLEEEEKAHFADENGRDSITFFIGPNITQRNFSLLSSAVQLTNIDTIQMKFFIVRPIRSVQGLSSHLTRNLSELRLNTLNFSPRTSLIR